MYQSRIAKTPTATRFRVVRPIECLMGRAYAPGDVLDTATAGVPERAATMLWRARDIDELVEPPVRDDVVVVVVDSPATKSSATAARAAPRGR